jgi:hypothetical protein
MNARIGFAAVLVLGGCSVQRLETNEVSPAESLFAVTTNWPAFAQAASGEPPRGAVDILFMVDNSGSMAPLQRQLAAGFDVFMNVIDGLPGGPPDLHIGVVSSDMGAGDDSQSSQSSQGSQGSIAGCDGRGDRGALQFVPRGTCTQTNLVPGGAFIELQIARDGSRIPNYFGTLSDVFGCIALLGEQGCGFEQSFSSVRHALDPALAPAENGGFLRRDAFLAVIMISNEDDCSAAPAVPLFDTTSNSTINSQLGPPTNFRCNEFGHLCGGAHPPRTATLELGTCESNDKEGYLERVASFVTFLRGLKPDPAKVFVASVAGPPVPYQVNVATPPIPDRALWPEIGHSCTAADGSYADPAVRLHQLTRSLGPYGHFESICGDGMSSSLYRIAARMTKPLAGSCVTRPSSSAACRVVDRWVDDQGIKQAFVVARCADAPGTTPCWSLVDDDRCRATDLRLDINRGGATVPPGLMTAIDCSGVDLP